MLTVAGALALLMLMLAVIQSVMRQDVVDADASRVRLPADGVHPLGGRDRRDRAPHRGHGRRSPPPWSTSLGSGQTSNLLQSVGDAYKNALDQSSGIPLFGVFLGAIILAIGAFVLWLEMIIRDAAIYICVFFLPLTFVAMIWPATSRWARRLVELLVAIILSKFVIVSILSLASAAITNTSVPSGDSATFEQMIAGAALLVLAAWSPFALLRLIPMMEVAAASVDESARVDVQQPRARPASRRLPHTCDRRWTGTHGRPLHRPTRPRAGRRTGSRVRPSRAARGRPTPRKGESAMRGTQGGGSQAGPSSSSSGGTVYPTGQQRGATTSPGSQRGSATQTDSPPASGTPSRPPTQQPRRPEPPPPSDGGSE